MTIHPTKHIDYSRGDRVDHLFVIGENTEFGGRMDPRRSVVDGPKPAETALLLTVTDTGLDCVLDSQTAGWRDRPRTKGWSLTWAEVIAAVQESDHNGVVTMTTVRSTADEVDTGTCGECGLEPGDPDCGCVCDCHHKCGVDESIEDPRLCDCGKGDWCPLWDSWTGPGKAQRDERAEAEVVMLEEHSGTLESFLTEMDELRRRVEETLSNG